VSPADRNKNLTKIGRQRVRSLFSICQALLSRMMVPNGINFATVSRVSSNVYSLADQKVICRWYVR
jgi:hypothetical protein